jgi:hypothetical protein
MTVAWNANYLLSLLGALIGSLLCIEVTKESGRRVSLGRVPAGMAVGVLLTALSFYGTSLGGWVPIPSFGDSHVVNALMTGVCGGWFGPSILWVLRRPGAPPSEVPPAGHTEVAASLTR